MTKRQGIIVLSGIRCILSFATTPPDAAGTDLICSPLDNRRAEGVDPGVVSQEIFEIFDPR